MSDKIPEVMSGAVIDKIIAMAGSQVDIEQLKQVLLGWGRYFLDMNIKVMRQQEEFDAIMRARVTSGSISLVPPATENYPGNGMPQIVINPDSLAGHMHGIVDLIVKAGGRYG